LDVVDSEARKLAADLFDRHVRRCQQLGRLVSASVMRISVDEVQRVLVGRMPVMAAASAAIRELTPNEPEEPLEPQASPQESFVTYAASVTRLREMPDPNRKRETVKQSNARYRREAEAHAAKLE